MRSSSTLKINLDALRHNVQYLSKQGEIMAMVKANAYGTDVMALAPHLHTFGVKMLGVSHVSEALALRQGGIELPIFVLSAPYFEAREVVQFQLQPAVSSFEEIEALQAEATNILPVHLHVDTGMNRFGIEPKKALALAAAIENAPSLRLEGIMTHFSSADIPKMDPFTHQQITLFKEVLSQLPSLPRWIHIANGPGALRFPLPFCNLLRIGLPLFGYGGSSLLRPALTFESHLTFISTPKRGESVGYQCGYRVEREKMRLGIIPVGYYDGIHRHYKEKGYVLVRGKKAPMVGNLCMDFMMLDLTEIPEASVGDTVTLFDSVSLSPETVAQWGETDVRELLASIGPRTKRLLTKDSDEQRVSEIISPLKENPSLTEYLLPT